MSLTTWHSLGLLSLTSIGQVVPAVRNDFLFHIPLRPVRILFLHFLSFLSIPFNIIQSKILRAFPFNTFPIVPRIFLTPFHYVPNIPRPSISYFPSFH